MLVESQVTVSGLLDDFSTSIQSWFPVLNLDFLVKEVYDFPNTCKSPSLPLLLLAILLITTRPCDHTDCLPCKRLHTTILSLSACMQSQLKSDMYFIQTRIITALYECGHGMSRQAHLTLSSAVAMAALEDASRREQEESLHMRVACMILDRYTLFQYVDKTG